MAHSTCARDPMDRADHRQATRTVGGATRPGSATMVKYAEASTAMRIASLTVTFVLVHWLLLKQPQAHQQLPVQLKLRRLQSRKIGSSSGHERPRQECDESSMSFAGVSLLVWTTPSGTTSAVMSRRRTSDPNYVSRTIDLDATRR